MSGVRPRNGATQRPSQRTAGDLRAEVTVQRLFFDGGLRREGHAPVLRRCTTAWRTQRLVAAVRSCSSPCWRLRTWRRGSSTAAAAAPQFPQSPSPPPNEGTGRTTLDSDTERCPVRMVCRCRGRSLAGIVESGRAVVMCAKFNGTRVLAPYATRGSYVCVRDASGIVWPREQRRRYRRCVLLAISARRCAIYGAASFRRRSSARGARSRSSVPHDSVVDAAVRRDVQATSRGGAAQVPCTRACGCRFSLAVLVRKFPRTGGACAVRRAGVFIIFFVFILLFLRVFSFGRWDLWFEVGRVWSGCRILMSARFEKNKI